MIVYGYQLNQEYLLFRVFNLPLITLHSNLNFNPITNDNQNNDNNLTLQFASFINNRTNNQLTADLYMSSEYDIMFNQQHFKLVKHIILNSINTPLYISNTFKTSLLPQHIKISKDAQRLLTTVNAGGESELSEAFSFEVLRRMFKAKLLKTEMEIEYFSDHCKITDYSIRINKIRVGVSVTRAMAYCTRFTKEDAMKLLNKKLVGVNESTCAVLERDQWERQVM